MADQQAQINALAAQLTTVNEQLRRALDEILAAIADLKAQLAAGTQLDFAALDAAVDTAAAAAQQFDDVVPGPSANVLPLTIPTDL